ncbi:type II toxin-antitoxin system RelE/ParE family toxin [Thiomicrorhabdus sp.]|uniref:type II toxin-antitoxin system RelE family toxin n=1 Tax=Thiomicrorhabdus sp. TaxID=2039724 RepID=UPI0029C6ABF0|nr:type II toxin-antitoxin system RelE/ParE family toxin [Thiomicrorhabdus sp.]
MFKVEWEKKALKQLMKLKNKIMANKIRLAVKDELPEFQKSKNVKALKNHDYEYRLRVGDFRVFFNVNDEIEIVFIEEVKKRDERTY